MEEEEEADSRAWLPNDTLITEGRLPSTLTYWSPVPGATASGREPVQAPIAPAYRTRPASVSRATHSCLSLQLCISPTDRNLPLQMFAAQENLNCSFKVILDMERPASPTSPIGSMRSENMLILSWHSVACWDNGY